MNCRPYGSKSTIAFWMIVAVADAAMLVAAAGPAVMLLVFAGLALLTGAVVAVRRFTRDRVPARFRLTTQRSVSTTQAVGRRHA
jgi:apolipoprotein N-acyltransferase